MKKKFIITFLLAVIVFSGAYIFFAKYLDILEASGPKENIRGVDLGENNVIEQVIEDEILFLLVGVDTNEPGLNQMWSRTDTMMLVKVNTKTSHIDLISLPRDTRVKINNTEDKINAAHAMGGMSLTLRTIREWLGIDLDYYVKVDYEALEEIVNAVGGVFVDVPMRIVEESIDIDIPEGYHRLSGRDALYFARYREGYYNADLGRIEQQQKLFKAILKQALSIENIPKIGDFLTTYLKRVDTNIPVSTMLGMVPAAKNMNSENISTYTIPGEPEYIDEISYYISNEDQTKALIRKVLSSYIIE